MTLPSAEAISRNLRDLFAKPAPVKAGGALPVAKVAFVAVYVDPEGTPRALGLADMEFAAFAGAALAMIPAGVAMESVKRRKLEDNLKENFYEVVNILAAAINVASGGHVRVNALVAPNAVPADAQSLLKKPSQRVDFEVTITDFGVCHLSFLAE